jgi:hypothetical protein
MKIGNKVRVRASFVFEDDCFEADDNTSVREIQAGAVGYVQGLRYSGMYASVAWEDYKHEDGSYQTTLPIPVACLEVISP